MTGPQRYVRRPVEVEAWQVTEANVDAVIEWRFAETGLPMHLHEKDRLAYVGMWCVVESGRAQPWLTTEQFHMIYRRDASPAA